MINKRATDTLDFDEIGDLIKQENDPKTRAILMVLHSINLSLIANTQAVNDTDQQLKQHMIEFRVRTSEADAMLNKGKGAWVILSAALIIAQAAIVWEITGSMAELKTMHAIDFDQATRITILEQTSRSLTRKYDEQKKDPN